MDEGLDSLSYWVGKYGLVEALRTYYPNTLKQDPELLLRLVLLETAEAGLREYLRSLGEKGG